MSEKKTNDSWQKASYNALYLGIFTALILYLQGSCSNYMLSHNSVTIKSLLSILAIFLSFAKLVICFYLFYIFSRAYYRENLSREDFNVTELIGYGVKLSFFSSIIVSAYSFVYYKFIVGTEVLQGQFNQVIAQLGNNSSISQSIMLVRDNILKIFVVSSFFYAFLWGVVLALILSYTIFKHDKWQRRSDVA